MNKSRSPEQDAIDLHIGKRIRRRRKLLGLSQMQVGELTGIRFQQIQKYETGGNRILSSRLFQIAIALNCPINYFFEGYKPQCQPSPKSAPPSKP